jgi:hypothetical protein
MKRPTKAQRNLEKAVHEAQDRRAIATREGIPTADLKMPEAHVIQIPIYRPVIVGERLTAATDVKAGTWGIEGIPRDLVNTVFNGQYLYFRRVTTVPLTIHVQ